MASPRIRLILADDHPIVLDGLRRLFESEADFEVVASAADGNSALEAVRSHPCDVLVIDLKMPGRNGLDVLEAIAAEKIPCRSVLLTAALKDDEVVRALRLGATLASVGSYSAGAHALYAAMGFVDYDLSEPWDLNA